MKMEQTILALDCVVEFDYSPPEAETGPTYACGGTPGCDAEVSINDVLWQGHSLRDHLNALIDVGVNVWNDIEDACAEYAKEC